MNVKHVNVSLTKMKQKKFSANGTHELANMVKLSRARVSDFQSIENIVRIGICLSVRFMSFMCALRENTYLLSAINFLSILFIYLLALIAKR